MPKPGFTQDPHRVRDRAERNLEAAIGREVRALRHQQGKTVADLAAATGLSVGMLSKIENGNTSPSLTTLQVLAHALSVPVTALFKASANGVRCSTYRPATTSRSTAAAPAPATSTTCSAISAPTRLA